MRNIRVFSNQQTPEGVLLLEHNYPNNMRHRFSGWLTNRTVMTLPLQVGSRSSYHRPHLSDIFGVAIERGRLVLAWGWFPPRR